MENSTIDPVAAHVAALDEALRGPADVRADIVREVRDGLDDAVDAYRRAGLDTAHAAELAVRDFGPVRQVAAQYQDELAADQGRRTALLLAIAFPALLLGWDLLWSSGVDWGEPSQTVRLLAVTMDVVTAVIAVTGLALMVMTLRRSAAPRRLAALTCLTAVVAVVATTATTVTMNVANGPESWTLMTTQPLATAGCLVSFAVLAAVWWSAVRTYRTLRTTRPRSRTS